MPTKHWRISQSLCDRRLLLRSFRLERTEIGTTNKICYQRYDFSCDHRRNENVLRNSVGAGILKGQIISEIVKRKPLRGDCNGNKLLCRDNSSYGIQQFMNEFDDEWNGVS